MTLTRSLASLLLCLSAAASFAATGPPDRDQKAATARWLVRNSSWGSLSTISTRRGGAPFGNIVSLADGPNGNVFFYLSPLDASVQDLTKDARASVALTEAATPASSDGPGGEPAGADRLGVIEPSQ